MKATDIRVETVEVTFDDERLSVPLHLSKGVIEAITYAAVTVRARTRGGGAVQGTGAILLSDVWAFPRARPGPRGKRPPHAPAVHGHRSLAGG